MSRIAQNDLKWILYDLEETLESHPMLFEAEKSRLEKHVVTRDEF